MKEFFGYIIGNVSLPLFFASFFFAFIGVSISLLMSASKRDQLNPTTPNLFSWSFLFSDNFKRIIGAFLLIYISIRLMPYIFEFIKLPLLESKEVYFGVCISIGLAHDRLMAYWKQKSNFLKVRKEDTNSQSLNK